MLITDLDFMGYSPLSFWFERFINTLDLILRGDSILIISPAELVFY